MDKRPRQDRNVIGHTTQRIVSMFKEKMGDEVEVINSEVDNKVRVRFSVESDPRSPNSEVVFTELDKLVQMSLYMNSHTNKEDAEEMVETVEEELTRREFPALKAISIEVHSDQGGNIFVPVIQVTNRDWANSEYQLDSIVEVFEVFLAETYQD